MNHFEFAYHVDKIAHLKQLGKYNKIQAYVDKQNPKMQSALSGWMSQTLADLQDDSVGARLPESSFCCIKGWQAFYRHQYADALQLFLQAQKQSDCHLFATDSSLGIAKVYTRTGHWQLAKDWCLYYLAKARDLSLSHVDIAKGYGALAEIFLRANKPQQSLGCFQIAYHLMPLQSGQKSKQYNFMASALLRHGEFLRAEALLQNSHQNNLRLLKADPENIELQSGLLHAHKPHHNNTHPLSAINGII